MNPFMLKGMYVCVSYRWSLPSRSLFSCYLCFCLVLLSWQGLNSYEAFQRYPEQVRRLQKLEETIRGGSTACLVILCGDVLYAANVGDSRALLYCEDGRCEQLTVDHDTNNEDELRRLQMLGLDHQEIRKNKRIGSHENTRSFGDYSLKEGYKDTDSLK